MRTWFGDLVHFLKGMVPVSLFFAGIIAIIALRLLYLAAFGDHAGRKEELTAFIPDRGDIVAVPADPLRQRPASLRHHC